MVAPEVLPEADDRRSTRSGHGKAALPMIHDTALAGRPGLTGSEAGPAIAVCFDIGEIEPEWRALDLNGARTPFQSLDWFKTYLAGAAGVRPVFVLAREAGRLVAIYPLAIRRSPVGTSLEWLAGHVADYNAPIVEPAFAERMPDDLFRSILAAVAEARPGIDYARFVRTLAGHPALPGTPPPAAGGMRTEYDSHALALEKDWQSYYRRLRSKDTRRRLRNKLMALRKEGTLRFMRVRSAEERVAVATRILDWKVDQLNRAGDGNPFGRGSDLRRMILSAAAEGPGPLEVYCLRLDGEPVAGVIVLLSREVFHLWVTAYNPAASSRHSIGLQLLVKTLELAARSGFRFYDFLYGDETYKADWCDIRIAMRHHYVPLSRRGALICRALAWRLDLKKRLIASPRAMQAIRGARRRVQALRARSLMPDRGDRASPAAARETDRPIPSPGATFRSS